MRTIAAEYDSKKGVSPVRLGTHYIEVGGRVTPVHVPERTAAEQAAYEARLDAAIRLACPGWRLAKQSGARSRQTGRRVGKEAAQYGASESEIG